MVPDKYIAQLIGDMVAAHKKSNDQSEISVFDDDEDDMGNHFKEVEDYLSFDFDNGPKFGKVVGLELVQFPAADKLEQGQTNDLYSAFLELLYSYHVTLDIPDVVPIQQKYTLALTVLNEAIFLCETGNVTWEFCTEESENCPFAEHCKCIEFERELEQNREVARQTLEDIIESCSTLFEENGSAKLIISDASEFEFNLLCMYIAGGIEYVPFEVYHNVSELTEACEKLIQLFSDDLELVSLFDDLTQYKVHSNLQVLLSLSVEKYEDNLFYVEPYYIENGAIYKGISPTYTPEELIRIIEEEDDDDEMPF